MLLWSSATNRENYLRFSAHESFCFPRENPRENPKKQIREEGKDEDSRVCRIWTSTTCRLSGRFMFGDPQSLSLWSKRSPESFSMKSCTIAARSSLSLLPEVTPTTLPPSSSNCLVDCCGTKPLPLPPRGDIQAAAGSCCEEEGFRPPPVATAFCRWERRRYGSGSPPIGIICCCCCCTFLKSAARLSHDNPFAAVAAGKCMSFWNGDDDTTQLLLLTDAAAGPW